MPFKGTNKTAWDKAKAGKTPAQRSKIYYREKAKSEKRGNIEPPKPTKSSSSFSMPQNYPRYNLPKTTLMPTVKPEKSEYTKPLVQNKPLPVKVKYVPKQLILDDIREYRSSKLISNISNGLATIVMKATRSRQMTNEGMNLIRSSVALVTSEVLNKALEKPLKIIDNIKMFIKVGKAIYKVVLWFNEKMESYEIRQESVQKVSSFSSEYKYFLQENPTIKKIYKSQVDLRKMLGKTVEVIVDRPIGSKHPEHENLTYELNYGHINGIYANDGEEQDAYIMGEETPLTKYKGIVIAIVKRLNDIEDKLVVATKGKQFSHQEISSAINFQEKFFEIELIVLDNK
jgi:inorganic pyrophosphatase